MKEGQIPSLQQKQNCMPTITAHADHDPTINCTDTHMNGAHLKVNCSALGMPKLTRYGEYKRKKHSPLYEVPRETSAFVRLIFQVGQ
jgi:hypothetical protein